MQIDRVYYPAQTLGYGNRIVIWTIGCPHHCFHCSNPELWESNPNRDISVGELIHALLPYLPEADGITITGGDPFWQKEALLELLKGLKAAFEGDILVFTGYTLDEIKRDTLMYQCLSYMDILIDGRYDEALNDNVGLRGSCNQTIYRLNNVYEHRYIDAETWSRCSQVVVCNNSIISVGIPIVSDH